MSRSAGAVVGLSVLLDGAAALFLAANSAVSPWLLLTFAAVDALVLATIAKRSLVGAAVVGAVVAFLVFMVGFAAATGALSWE
ncbi:MAG TPA: hypothetical protein VNB24_06520 [Acidimicrobiales bacterium]|nr:hypothetical protein [Acidimicrobiales bacterium]